MFRPRISVTLALIALISACGKGIDTAKWTEEVRLHDGSMVVVERVARGEPRGLLSESRGMNIDFELHYPPLGVHWRSARRPWSFEIFDGIAYLVTTVEDPVGACRGRPAATLLMSVWKQAGGRWIEVDASAFPAKTALINLYDNYWGLDSRTNASGLIAWEFKEGRDAYPFVDGKMSNPRRARTVEEFHQMHNLTCARVQKDQNL